MTTITVVEHSLSPPTCIEHSLQQRLDLPIMSTDVEHSLSPFTCVEHSPLVATNTADSLTLPSTTISNVEQTPLQEQVLNSYNTTPADYKDSFRCSTLNRIFDNPFQTPITLVPRTVDTPSRCLLPCVPPTSLDTPNILSASNIHIEVDASTPTAIAEHKRLPNTQNIVDVSIPSATAKRRRLPDTPVVPPTGYKQCLLLEIDRYLINPSPNTSTHNSSVIEYLRDEIN